MITEAVTAAAAYTIVRKPFGMKPSNFIMLGLLGATIAACFSKSTTAHVAAGALFTGAVGLHVWKHRKAL